MKSLINTFLLLFVYTLFYSCSDNDENDGQTQSSEFFNINVGSKWVYKRYSYSINSEQFIFSGIIDTLKIVEMVNFQGLTFAKRSSSLTNTYSYLRVNNLGHLVLIDDIYNYGNLNENSGITLHPGTDYDFVYSRVFDYGTLDFQLYNLTNIIVEGNNYSVLPYKGVFTPNPTYPDLVSKVVQVNYEENTGLVISDTHAVAGNNKWEDRLVSYELN
jgi:hypothetical protein